MKPTTNEQRGKVGGAIRSFGPCGPLRPLLLLRWPCAAVNPSFGSAFSDRSAATGGAALARLRLGCNQRLHTAGGMEEGDAVKHLPLALVAVVCLAVAFAASRAFNKRAMAGPALPAAVVQTNLPPGFSLVCDNRAGLFAPCRDGAVYYGRGHTNRQDAIDHAWWLYERWTNRPPAEVQRNWEECEGAKP